jgi:hypothetical protein
MGDGIGLVLSYPFPRLDPFRPEPDPHDAGGEAAEEGAEEDEEEAGGGGEGEDLAGAAEHAAVDEDLSGLDAADGHLAAALDGLEVGFGDPPFAQRRGEAVGGGHGVLHGEVDADPAGGGHGVGGVADQQEPRAVPGGKAVDLHGQQLDLLPVVELAQPVAQEGGGVGDGALEGGQTLLADLPEAPLADDQGALEVVAAVEGDQHRLPLDPPQHGGGIVGALRDAEPEHVDRHPEILDLHPGPVAHRRAAAVRPHHEVGPHLELPVGGLRLHPHDPPVLGDQVGDLRVHQQMEGGIALAVRGEEVEEVPLRHQRDELAVGGEVREVRTGVDAPLDLEVEPRDLLVGHAQELVEEAELVHQLEGRGMDGVAAEIAEEVGVLLEHHHLDPGAGEQEAEHHSRRAAAGDAAGGLEGTRRLRGVGHRWILSLSRGRCNHFPAMSRDVPRCPAASNRIGPHRLSGQRRCP